MAASPEHGFWADPPWWFREIVLAVVIGLALLGATWVLESERSERAEELERRATVNAEQLENLRFVRERSSGSTTVRPFAGLDLRGQNLSGLELSGANFRDADLRGADFTGANLRDADLLDADLRGALLAFADLRAANLSSADLSEGAELHRADLRGANLFSADLEGTFGITTARLAGSCHGDTNWPDGFNPPHSNCRDW